MGYKTLFSFDRMLNTTAAVFLAGYEIPKLVAIHSICFGLELRSTGGEVTVQQICRTRWSGRAFPRLDSDQVNALLAAFVDEMVVALQASITARDETGFSIKELELIAKWLDRWGHRTIIA
ncbi:Hypothetical protein D9617_2g053660 [Elsinoe fawcettii]|nr:Hypothetical protein D9617_2g053660 [Elsinoe fawcettii]